MNPFVSARALKKIHAFGPVSVIAFALGFNQTAAHEDVTLQVPFALQNGSVVLQVRIADQGPFNMQLSTNAEVSKVSFDVLKSLHLMPNFSNDPRTVNPDAMILYRDVPNVQMGNLKLSRLAFQVFDPTKISNRLGVRIDGVLGYNFLDKRVVQIDYPNNIVRFLESSPQPSQINRLAAKRPTSRENCHYQLTPTIQSQSLMRLSLRARSSGRCLTRDRVEPWR